MCKWHYTRWLKLTSTIICHFFRTRWGWRCRCCGCGTGQCLVWRLRLGGDGAVLLSTATWSYLQVTIERSAVRLQVKMESTTKHEKSGRLWWHNSVRGGQGIKRSCTHASDALCVSVMMDIQCTIMCKHDPTWSSGWSDDSNLRSRDSSLASQLTKKLNYLKDVS